MKKTVAIIGGGPSALLLAAHLDSTKFEITIYEKNAGLGRKFLVAGQGGFNLTHSEDVEIMLTRYTPSSFLKKALEQFSNVDLKNWLATLGIQTYTGTSKRVFPVKGIKPVDVLNAILNLLKNKGVNINTNYAWKGFDKDNALLFNTLSGEQSVVANTVIFALGGGSWKVTGSDGTWLKYFEEKRITCEPFRASNCAFGIAWPALIKNKIKGKELKNCSFTVGEKEIKGEVVLTEFGIEGSGVYPLSNQIRKQLDEFKCANLYIDFKPQLSKIEIQTRLEKNGKKALTKFLETNLKLNKVTLLLLKSFLSKEDFTDVEKLSSHLKKFKLQITSLATIDEAISTVGGISLSEITTHYELKKIPNHYALGEMLDWDAPTGGYLLQACFSMGYDLALYLNKN